LTRPVWVCPLLKAHHHVNTLVSYLSTCVDIIHSHAHPLQGQSLLGDRALLHRRNRARRLHHSHHARAPDAQVERLRPLDRHQDGRPVHHLPAAVPGCGPCTPVNPKHGDRVYSWHGVLHLGNDARGLPRGDLDQVSRSEVLVKVIQLGLCVGRLSGKLAVSFGMKANGLPRGGPDQVSRSEVLVKVHPWTFIGEAGTASYINREKGKREEKKTRKSEKGGDKSWWSSTWGPVKVRHSSLCSSACFFNEVEF
jgi:hypothetical protein